MELFKKIEKWIGSKDEFAKCILVLFWILWAFAQIDHVSMGDRKAAQRNFELERAGAQEIVRLYSCIEKEAKLKGDKYGPKDYFADYRRIEEGRYDIKKRYPDLRYIDAGGYGPTTPFSTLQQIIYANQARGLFEWDDISREAEKFKNWKLDGGGTEAGESLKLFQGFDFWKKIRVISKWLLVFYLRSLILVFAWYLLGMCKRRGILETILADKRKFVLAIIAWPMFIWRYPSNVLREIRVEAELRRMGNVFRRFSAREKLFVQKIANGDHYGQWLISYRQRNSGRFRTGLLFALMVTIMFASVAPAFCLGAVCSGVDPPAQEQSIIVSGDHQDVGWQQHDDGFPDYVLPERRLEIFCEKMYGRFMVAPSIVLQDFVKRIEHVPLPDFLVKDMIIPIT